MDRDEAGMAAAITNSDLAADVPDAEPPYAWWAPLWEFAVHVVVGTLIFVIIYTPAILLNILVHWMTEFNLDGFVVQVVLGAEYSLIVADSLLFLTFLTKTTWRTAKKL